jgi:FkbM family methyltransferase
VKGIFVRAFMQTASVMRSEGLGATFEKLVLVLGMKVAGPYFYQIPLIKCIRTNSPFRQTFVDVGASTGTVVGAVAHLFDYCIAVEPAPSNFAALEKCLSRFRNCQTYACALSSTPGILQLHVSLTNRDDNRVWGTNNPQNAIAVGATTLDLLVSEAHARGPFLIKIDAQGWDLEVLKGARTILEQDTIVVSEFSPHFLKCAGSSGRDFLEYMRNLGYGTYDLRGHKISSQQLQRICDLGDRDEYVVLDLLFKKT